MVESCFVITLFIRGVDRTTVHQSHEVALAFRSHKSFGLVMDNLYLFDEQMILMAHILPTGESRLLGTLNPY